jgi:hypothetical protein
MKTTKTTTKLVVLIVLLLYCFFYPTTAAYFQVVTALSIREILKKLSFWQLSILGFGVGGVYLKLCQF